MFVTDDVAAREGGRLVRSAQVQRDSLAPCRCGRRLAVNLKAPHAKQLIAWETTNLVANADLAALRRTGDDQAVSQQDEHAIDGQAEVARWRLLLPASQNLRDLRP